MSPLEYELIDISITQTYDIEGEECFKLLSVHDDENADATDVKPDIQYDADGIPMGQSMEEVRMRERLISQYLHEWTEKNPERRIFNHSLNDFIFIRGKSVAEMMQHSSKRYLSTCAVLHFEVLLASANLIDEVPTKPGNGKQAEFDHMLVMSYDHHVFGTVKITVGVKKSNAQHIQYGMTVLREGESIINYERQQKKQGCVKNKKARHK